MTPGGGFVGFPASPFNPGVQNYRKVALTGRDAVSQTGGTILGYTFRNASSSPVYVNIYDAPASQVQVGGVGHSTPVMRVAIPAAPSGGFGEKVMSPSFWPVRHFPSGITIAPVTSDADDATAAGSVYVEIDYVNQGADN